MIPITGLSTNVGLSLVDATRDRQLEVLRDSVEHARAISAFRERISSVQSVAQLIEDRELYVFVMKTFDLEDQIFGKAMVRKILESDITERTALVNRLTDPRFREMHEVMGFGADGIGNSNTSSLIWQEQMVDRYLETKLINDVAEQNASVGIVLEFRRKVAGIEKPLDILKDRETAAFIRRALGLPDAIALLDIDRQEEIISSRLDLSELKDPSVVDKLIRKYVALSDALNPQGVFQNASVVLMQNAVNTGRFVNPIPLDVSAVSGAPSRPYLS